MNFDLLSLILFYSLIIIIFLWKKERFTIQSKIFVLYKTSLGLGLMEKISRLRYRRLLAYLGYLGVVVGFCGMIFVFFFLIKETFKFLVVANAIPPLAPILPGVQVPGAPRLSFWHWIISIFVVAVVHEFSHGVFAKFHGINIKSSGFAFLGPILAAFVEPDEKQLSRKKSLSQLSVFAAGPFSNLVLALFFILLFNFAMAPLEAKMFEPVDGVMINDLLEGYPMERANIKVPFVIQGVNGEEVSNLSGFIRNMEKIKPGEEVVLQTDKGEYKVVTVKNPSNASKSFLGVTGFSNQKIKPAFRRFTGAISNINLLVIWLFIINFGVGLFNLLPIGPVDGGRMFYVALLSMFKTKKIARAIFSFVSMACLILIFVNLVPWLLKLVKFLFSSVSSFF